MMITKSDTELRALPGIVRCKRCGEQTTHVRESSFYGSVHRWGPTTHEFVPRPATPAEALADAQAGSDDDGE